MGLCLELAYPITSCSESRDDSMDSAPFRHQLPLNSFIDSILRTVYHASAPAPPPPTDPHGARRQIIFTSSSPDACAAVNWKQPNCQSHLPSLSLSSSSFFFLLFLSLFATLQSKVKRREKKKRLKHRCFPPLPPDPVLFASSCGEVGANPPSTTAAIRNDPTLDLRLTSISAAVEFSNNNNLLGVFLDTYLLVGSLWLNEA
jgi:CDK inhibitor PHO81